MGKETGTLDLKALKVGHGDASTKATNYIEATASDGIKVHNAGDSSTYVQIVSGAIDFVRSGTSAMKLWLVGTVSKIRLGDEDGKHIAIDSSSGVAVMDGADEVAGFGSTMHIGKVANDSRYLSIDSSGNGVFHGAKLDIFDYPYDQGTELSKGTIRHHYVKVANNGNNQPLHAVSLYASASDTRVGLYDETNSKWILQSMFQDPNVDVLVTIPQSFAIGKRMYLPNGTEIWDNAQGVTHLLTPTASNKKAEFTFEPDGKIYRRTSANGGTSWTSWTSIAG